MPNRQAPVVARVEQDCRGRYWAFLPTASSTGLDSTSIFNVAAADGADTYKMQALGHVWFSDRGNDYYIDLDDFNANSVHIASDVASVMLSLSGAARLKPSHVRQAAELLVAQLLGMALTEAQEFRIIAARKSRGYTLADVLVSELNDWQSSHKGRSDVEFRQYFTSQVQHLVVLVAKDLHRITFYDGSQVIRLDTPGPRWSVSL